MDQEIDVSRTSPTSFKAALFNYRRCSWPTVMLVAGVVSFGAGCTAQQLQTAEASLHRAVVNAQAVGVAVQHGEAEAKAILPLVNKLNPELGIRLQDALKAYDAHEGTLEQVMAVLAEAEVATRGQ